MLLKNRRLKCTCTIMPQKVVWIPLISSVLWCLAAERQGGGPCVCFMAYWIWSSIMPTLYMLTAQRTRRQHEDNLVLTWHWNSLDPMPMFACSSQGTFQEMWSALSTPYSTFQSHLLFLNHKLRLTNGTGATYAQALALQGRSCCVCSARRVSAISTSP